MILVAYQLMYFAETAPRKFDQLNYVWDQQKTLIKANHIKVIELDYNRLVLAQDTLLEQYEVEHTLRVHWKGEPYYFRAESRRKTTHSIAFNGGWWINDVPPQSIVNESVRVDLVDLPVMQKGHVKICMIGDSQVLYREAKRLRRLMAKNSKDLVFVGNKKDVFGYPYVGGTFYNLPQLLNDWDDLPIADAYILWLGNHEQVISNDSTQWHALKEKWEKNNQHIVLVSPTNSQQAKAWSPVWKSMLNNANIQLVNTQKIIPNDSLYMLSDQLHLTLPACKLMAKALVNQLQHHHD